nr:zinc finger BED domain-containing protein RICESLEEPER 2-like [Tanacetum cinerariifolium]
DSGGSVGYCSWSRGVAETMGSGGFSFGRKGGKDGRYQISLGKKSYMALTSHCINNERKLNKKFLNFCRLDGHSGVDIGKGVESCVNGWSINDIMAILVDNASANDAHILNLVVQDGIKSVDKGIKNIEWEMDSHKMVNSPRFPILSLMARNLLAIPVSAVAFKSVFSTNGRVLDIFRSSLSDKSIESLTCTQDRLRKDRTKFYKKKKITKQ